MAALLWDIPGDEDIQESREPEELSVFGYACKLFRNDHKAISIDREEHLIPWMGDSSLFWKWNSPMKYKLNVHDFDVAIFVILQILCIKTSGSNCQQYYFYCVNA
jgi:hypothetical protein